MELEPCYFLNILLRFWLFEPHLLINFFGIKSMYMAERDPDFITCWLIMYGHIIYGNNSIQGILYCRLIEPWV